MGTRTLDLRPTKVHGQPRATATGPVGSSPRRSRSLGKIVTPWLRGMLVALGAAVGPLPAAANTAKPPGKPTATQAACGSQLNANGPTWMGDLAPCITNRRLSDIVIPGSHSDGNGRYEGAPKARWGNGSAALGRVGAA